jgi:hypothetical protein
VHDAPCTLCLATTRGAYRIGNQHTVQLQGQCRFAINLLQQQPLLLVLLLQA